MVSFDETEIAPKFLSWVSDDGWYIQQSVKLRAVNIVCNNLRMMLEWVCFDLTIILRMEEKTKRAIMNGWHQRTIENEENDYKLTDTKENRE